MVCLVTLATGRESVSMRPSAASPPSKADATRTSAARFMASDSMRVSSKSRLTARSTAGAGGGEAIALQFELRFDGCYYQDSKSDSIASYTCTFCSQKRFLAKAQCRLVSYSTLGLRIEASTSRVAALA